MYTFFKKLSLSQVSNLGPLRQTNSMPTNLTKQQPWSPPPAWETKMKLRYVNFFCTLTTIGKVEVQKV
jgi:hypothetical protein